MRHYSRVSKEGTTERGRARGRRVRESGERRADWYLDIYPRSYFRETLVMFSFFLRAENATGLIGLHSENR